MHSMKKVFKIAKILIPALILFFILIFILFPKPSLSEDQKNTVKIFGYPSQFVITYLPRGDVDNPQLVRSETWYYPKQQTKINFLAGKLTFEEEYISEEDTEDTDLKPEDFDFFLNFNDISAIFGEENIIPIDFIPGLYEEGEISTYLTDSALFIMESDQLTYFQTLDAKGDDVFDLENIEPEKNEDVKNEPDHKPIEKEDESEEKVTTENWKTYQNERLSIKMKYPPEWYLEDEDIVFSSYDTGYMEKGLGLPEKRLKCDFNEFNLKYFDIKDEELFLDGDVKISKGLVVDKSGEEGPGMGDGVVFVFEKEGENSIALICFSYNDDFEEKLKESFKTFEFIEKDEY